MASGGADDKYILASCELYDTATCKWSPIATLNIPRAFHAAAMHNYSVYVFGGESGDYKVIAEIEQYDADANKWTLLKALLSQARRDLAAACVDSRIYIVGGAIWEKNQSDENKRLAVDVIDSFDAEKKQCSPSSKLPNARYAHALASYTKSLSSEPLSSKHKHKYDLLKRVFKKK